MTTREPTRPFAPATTTVHGGSSRAPGIFARGSGNVGDSGSRAWPMSGTACVNSVGRIGFWPSSSASTGAVRSTRSGRALGTPQRGGCHEAEAATKANMMLTGTGG